MNINALSAQNDTGDVQVATSLRRLGASRHLQVTVSGPTGGAVEDWSVLVRIPAQIIGCYGVKCDAVSSSTYRLTPDPFNRSIPSGGTVEVGVLFAA